MHSFRSLYWRISFVTLTANFVGALLTFFFFEVLDPQPVGRVALRRVAPIAFVSFAVVMVILFAIGLVWSYRVFANLGEWYGRVQKGEAANTLPPAVKRQALNLVPQLTLITLTMWVLAGLFFSGAGMLTGDDVTDTLRSFVGITGVGGALTGVLVYFLTDLLWRPALPIFFPDGRLSAVTAFRLPILGRLLIVFLLTGILPPALLVYLSLRRMSELASAPNRLALMQNLILLELFILVVSVIGVVVMAFLMTRSITHPLRELQNAMARVEQSDLAARVPVVTNDELGYLGERFNLMTDGLRQGEMMRTLLNLYVSPEVARQALEQGVQLGGALVDCTVLFSDIRDFTNLSERLSPHDLIATINRYMTAMVSVVTANGGIVNKFGGDSLLAIFGTPLNPLPAHAASAVQTALDMRSALAQFNTAQREQNAPTMRIGIGIASGAVVAGNVGGRERIEYTVIGDTVNLAARLQDKTKELGHDILLNAVAYRAASSTSKLSGTRQTVSIRGKQDPVDVYVLE